MKYRFARHWNYRVVTQMIKGVMAYDLDNPANNKQFPDERLFSITEVYYDKEGNPDSYVEPEKVQLFVNNESIDDLIWIRKKIKNAFKKPMLDLDNWPSEYKEE